MEVNGRIDREKMSSTILEEDQEGVSIYWHDILFIWKKDQVKFAD